LLVVEAVEQMVVAEVVLVVIRLLHAFPSLETLLTLLQ
jgi:hypothetical protein